MIIDFHAHWWPSPEYVNSREIWDFTIAAINKMYYAPLKENMTDDDLKSFYFDPDATMLLKQMDEAGIDKTVILPLDWGLIMGEPEKNILEQNKVYAQLSQKYPDRIISFFTIDPKRDNIVQSFKTAVEEWGMRGLKLYPPTGFYPVDTLCDPLYEICLEHTLPVVFHGSPSPLQKEEYSHPNNIGALAEKYPDLKIIIAHSGGAEWVQHAMEAYRKYKNIYWDISGWQIISQDIEGYANLLNSNLQSLDKICFGTDNPIFNGIRSPKDWVRDIQALDVSEGDRASILGGCAQKLLGLSDK